MKQQGHNQSGFTLIELTAALFIVTLGIFGAIQVYLLSMDATRALQENAVAQRVVRAQMESLRAQPAEALVLGKALPFIEASPEIEKLMHAQGAVDIMPVEGAPDLLEVQVRLAWIGQHGRRIEKTLVTYIATRLSLHTSKLGDHRVQWMEAYDVHA